MWGAFYPEWEKGISRKDLDNVLKTLSSIQLGAKTGGKKGP